MATVKFSKNVRDEEDTHTIVSGSQLTFAEKRSIRIIDVVLFILVLVLLIVVIALSVVLGVQNQWTPEAILAKNYCTSPDCLTSTVSMTQLMNRSTDPCANFHEYSCGNFATINPLNPSRPSISTLSKIRYENNERLERILEGSLLRLQNNSTKYKAKAFYQSCMNEYELTKASGIPLVGALDDALGTWYIKHDEPLSKFDFNEGFKKTHADYMVEALHNYKIRPDNGRSIIEIDQSGLGMYYAYYTMNATKHIRDAYKTYMRTIAKFLIRDANVTMSSEVQERRLNTFVDDVFSFETHLANFTSILPPSENPHDTDFRYTLGELYAKAGEIKWIEFFQYMFNQVNPRLTHNTEVIVREKYYLFEVNDLINGLGAEKNRILNNYLTWRLAQYYSTDLSWDYIHAAREFYEATTGRTQFQGTWQYCFNLVSRTMKDAVGAMFAKMHFKDKSKPEVEKIAQHVKQVLLERLPYSEWMDARTRKTATEKLKTIVDKIGYPPFLLNDAKLDLIYSRLEIDPKNFFKNVLSIAQFERSYWNDRLQNGIDRNEWRVRVYDVHAQYNQYWNEVLVPAGILQLPIYSTGLPKYMSYGSIGSIFGHEFVNSIDAIGGYYLPNGSFVDWWSKQSTKNYNKEKKCVVDYYNKLNNTIRLSSADKTFKIPIKGSYYSRFAIAETGGIKNAYYAYKQWIKENGKELLTPAINLTNEQAFFVAYAQTNCYVRTALYKLRLAQRNIVPEEIRTNGAMAHIEEFQKAFNCPPKSKMSAYPKCNVF
ncbi:endothelin-converting enzyme homolog isoform X1 [Tubulanus polymorphus]|uniref:endothelin-converting enzyme homolog isoform X1 n=1 Tax=Tubulanus polymorphus TaxID=672921 RepID=UPI003DA4A02C